MTNKFVEKISKRVGRWSLQKLYREVRRAVERLFVRPTQGPDAGRWLSHNVGTGIMSPSADLAQLPGPCGAQQLTLLPSSSGSIVEQPKALLSCYLIHFIHRT